MKSCIYGGKYNVENKYYIKNQTVENDICAIDLEFRECKKDKEDTKWNYLKQ